MIFTGSSQPNLILLCYNPNPIMPSLQKESPGPLPSIVSSVEQRLKSVALTVESITVAARPGRLLCQVSKDKAIHFHQNSHGKVIHNHRTLSQCAGLWKIGVFHAYTACVLTIVGVCVLTFTAY